MRIILIGNFPVCLSLYNSLLAKKFLQAVCFQDYLNLKSEQDFWVHSIQEQGLETFNINEKNIQDQFKNWLKVNFSGASPRSILYEHVYKL